MPFRNNFYFALDHLNVKYWLSLDIEAGEEVSNKNVIYMEIFTGSNSYKN